MFLGVDIGTSNSKAVIVGESGEIIASAAVVNHTANPRPGWYEHDAASVWWSGLRSLVALLRQDSDLSDIAAMGVSGIGPVVLPADRADRPLRPAILYGIDTRAEQEIGEMTRELGAGAILLHAGNPLSSQAVGPKLRWLSRHEPETFARMGRWHTCASYLVAALTGEYVCDHYTASASDPMYDITCHYWWEDAWAFCAPNLERPRLAWPGEVVGTLRPRVAAQTGLRANIPVIAGTTDALAEAYSVGCAAPGDTMVMYGSTMFCIQVVDHPVPAENLWAAVGRTRDSYSSAAGMSTSGLLATWFAQISGEEVPQLIDLAAGAPPGSAGLVLLPYFAGERTPLFDPRARGCWLGLTLRHSRAHMARSILESVGFGIRSNFDAMAALGPSPQRLVAVGGGTRSALWLQIISDITGYSQSVPSTLVGASYGDARMCADALEIDTAQWNPVERVVEPDVTHADLYAGLYEVFRAMYPAVCEGMHHLAAIESATQR